MFSFPSYANASKNSKKKQNIYVGDLNKADIILAFYNNLLYYKEHEKNIRLKVADFKSSATKEKAQELLHNTKPDNEGNYHFNTIDLGAGPETINLVFEGDWVKTVEYDLLFKYPVVGSYLIQQLKDKVPADKVIHSVEQSILRMSPEF